MKRLLHIDTPQKSTFVLNLILVLVIPGFLGAQAGRKKVAEGNKLFNEEKYDEASNKYQDALLEDPSSPAIQYNVGNVLYKKKNYEKALEAYNKSLDSDDPLFQSKTYYNMGNTLYRHGKLPESILAYERALKLNPDDLDAKYNLEFIRNKLKENAQPEQQEQQGQQQQSQQEQNKEQQDEQQNDEEEEQQEQQPQQGEQKEMSKEEAERLLDALKENQEDLKKKQVKGQGKVRVKKDW